MNYKVEVVPGGENKETEVTVTVTGEGLKNNAGEKVSEITFTDKKLWIILLYIKITHVIWYITQILTSQTVRNRQKVYLDDIRIYAPPTLSRDATLVSLCYGEGNTSVTGFSPGYC